MLGGQRNVGLDEAKGQYTYPLLRAKKKTKLKDHKAPGISTITAEIPKSGGYVFSA